MNSRFHLKRHAALTGLLLAWSFCFSSTASAIAITGEAISNASQDEEASIDELGERIDFKVGEYAAFIIRPTADTLDPIPWIIYAPTLGDNLPGSAEHWMFRQFLEAGIAIAGVNVGESYGSPNGRAGFDALYDHVTEQHRFAEQACLLARSRGGLMVYAWAADNPTKVRCITGIYPVCNLTSYPGLERACVAYEMTQQELAEALTDHNPVDRVQPLAEARIPIYHIHGDVDTVVPLEANTGLLADRFEAAGWEMVVDVAEGQGHNMWRGFFECQDLVDFLIKHATQPDRENE